MMTLLGQAKPIAQKDSEPVTISVGLGELKTSRDANTILACYGLGSCVAVAAYDPVAKTGGLIHVVIPFSANGTSEQSPAKFANTGIPKLVDAMVKHGALKSRLIIKIAGGASMLKNVILNNELDVGARNQEAVTKALSEAGLRLKASNVGGSSGRSLRFMIDSGRVTIRTAASTPIDL